MPRAFPPVLSPEHLGDGVYASHDGHQIWLGLVSGSQIIALEPPTLTALGDYYRRHFPAFASGQIFPPRTGGGIGSDSGSASSVFGTPNNEIEELKSKIASLEATIYELEGHISDQAEREGT